MCVKMNKRYGTTTLHQHPCGNRAIYATGNKRHQSLIYSNRQPTKARYSICKNITRIRPDIYSQFEIVIGQVYLEIWESLLNHRTDRGFNFHRGLWKCLKTPLRRYPKFFLVGRYRKNILPFTLRNL